MTTAATKAIADFERFWSAYPRRPDNPKAMARKRFLELLKRGIQADDLVAAAGVFAARLKARGLDAEFIPYASTWLHQSRFEDYLPDPTAEAAAPPGDHPLAWMAPVIGDDAFRSWIAPADAALIEGLPTIITFHTRTALLHVRQTWGRLLADRLGEIEWRVANIEGSSHA